MNKYGCQIENIAQTSNMLHKHTDPSFLYKRSWNTAKCSVYVTCYCQIHATKTCPPNWAYMANIRREYMEGVCTYFATYGVSEPRRREQLPSYCIVWVGLLAKRVTISQYYNLIQINHSKLYTRVPNSRLLVDNPCSAVKFNSQADLYIEHI